MANLTGELIANRYRVISLVASGGMASVYLAQDQVLERNIALKVIHPHLSKDKSFVDKFQREAKMAAQLSHPNLVNVFDQGTDGEVSFLVMEYVPGITLRDAMNDFGALDYKKTLEIIEPLTAALAAAHAAGILHRDLKPENVFLSDGGAIKLGDFGLAREISQHTQTGSVVGTVAYLSPELVLRGQADARSDVYSLGVVIFEMLTGQQPYRGEQAVQVAYQHANDNIPAPSTLNPMVPELLDEIVLWCTARNPSDRPASAKLLLPVIAKARADLASGSTPKFTAAQNKTARLSLADGDYSANTEIMSEQDLQTLQPAPGDTATRLEKANKRSKVWLTFFTVLALFAGSGAGWWFSSGPGGLAVIPELTGRSLDAAILALEPLGVQIIQAEESSATAPEGTISRTDPPAGSRIFKNSALTLFVSTGPKLLEVPDTRGLDTNEASDLLTESGFAIGSTLNFYSAEPAGGLLGLSAAPGEILNEGSKIDLRVSLGPLPEVRGISSERAQELLADLGVQTELVEVFNNEIASGLAIKLLLSEDPLPENGTVVLEVSKGAETVAMPNLEGETIEASKNLLENLGLVVLIDTNQLSSNFGIAKVTRQSPAAGTQVRVGETVTIVSR